MSGAEVEMVVWYGTAAAVLVVLIITLITGWNP